MTTETAKDGTGDEDGAVALCRDVKHGRVTLACELPRGHGGWHKAAFRDRQVITYLGAHHIVEMTETVTWESVDHVKEAVRHLMTKAGREGEVDG